MNVSPSEAHAGPFCPAESVDMSIPVESKSTPSVVIRAPRMKEGLGQPKECSQVTKQIESLQVTEGVNSMTGSKDI